MYGRQLLTDTLKRLIEAEPGLYTHHEQIERIGSGQPNPVLTALGHARENNPREQITEAGASER